MFNAEDLRLIRAMVQTAMAYKEPKDYHEPWKSVYEKATEQLRELGENI